MNSAMKTAPRIIAVMCVTVLSAGLATGCLNKAPQLTPEQLSAGVIAVQHPVSQEEATKRGCDCHLQK